MLIAKHLGSSSRFNGYSFIEDMISDGIARVMTAALPKLDPNKECFSYITRTIWCAFIWRIQNEKKHWNIKCSEYERLTGEQCSWKNNYGQQDAADEHGDDELEEQPD